MKLTNFYSKSIILGLFLISISLTKIYGQATITIGSLYGLKSGDTILIPVNVTNFDTLQALGLCINIDTINLKFDSLINLDTNLVNASIGGYMYIFDKNNSRLKFTWGSTAAYCLNFGPKLFDMEFIYFGPTTICFCETRPDDSLYKCNGLSEKLIYTCGIIDAIQKVQENKMNMTFNLYPNPNKGEFNLEFTDSQGSYDLEISDYFGRTVNKIFITTNNGHIAHINSGNLSNGIYSIRLKNEKEIFKKTMMIMK
jgi:hypothetical protein